ncbi:repressor of RNA polymerase III transcription MAF1 [Trichodelitschia bisporula]|uniref:Repressor of RNA polymerase III transcription MAF1 n=1 Tax=Trichodelitschia bisporula TaxID=703511 RepID=A0A6G1HPD6_9PEZI|nr:repressor of RNA polymerase III transcription MAF1 [Trichodelitschia bisporula]
MKFIPIHSFEDVSDALCFEHGDIRISGSCELFTTKATKCDKKLYKAIDKELEARHESVLRLAASLSPPQAEEFAISSNLSRSSPFGNLSQPSNRRTFAYLIATLNASHPDYNFSHFLRPTDFDRERSLRDVIQNVDSKVFGAHGQTAPLGLQTPGGSFMWGPRMWNLIDEEMDLEACEIYSFHPDQNPFDEDDPALWRLHYFFFNKGKKRVCYLYLLATSESMEFYEYDSDSTDVFIDTGTLKFGTRGGLGTGPGKLARYWSGDRAEGFENGEETSSGGTEKEHSTSFATFSGSNDGTMNSIGTKPRERRKGDVRAMSEGVAESIEL